MNRVSLPAKHCHWARDAVWIGDSASTKAFSGDRGNIALKTIKGVRVSHLVLWPNVRPWQWLAPQPMLCCIRDFTRAAQQLKRAVAASATHHIDSDASQPVTLAGMSGA